MNYKFGVIINHKFKSGYCHVALCSCGQANFNLNRYQSIGFQCEKCGNEFFVNYPKTRTVDKNGNYRFILPHLELLRKDNRGFKALRVNLSIIHKPEDYEFTVVKENLKRTIDYDIVDRRFTIHRDDELEFEYMPDVDVIIQKNRLQNMHSKIFKNLSVENFIDAVSNDTTRDIFNLIYDMGKRYSYNRTTSNMLYGLLHSVHVDKKWLQILANAGIPNLDRFTYNYGNARSCIDETKTKPHEILKVPRFMIPFIRENLEINGFVLERFQKVLNDSIDVNRFRDVMNIVKDEGDFTELSRSIEIIMSLNKDYGYSNLRKLILYLFREVKLTQGIANSENAVVLLRDYVRMSRAMDLEFERYPKSLKKVHDVVNMNYNLINKDTKKTKEFSLAVDKPSYKQLEYQPRRDRYKIIIPKEPKDLVKEGNELSHCVASYVNSIISEKCKIVFLRDVELEDKPLVTIEIRNMNVRQAKGYGNRQVTDEQKEFIRGWAKANNLVEDYY